MDELTIAVAEYLKSKGFEATARDNNTVRVSLINRKVTVDEVWEAAEYVDRRCIRSKGDAVIVNVGPYI